MSFGGARLPTWKDHARNFQDWFGSWGSSTRNVQAIYDGVVPVAVVDEFRDDTQGSLYAISAFTPGLFGEHSAVAMGSAVNDIEVFSVSARAIHQPGGFALGNNDPLHLFTPINPYNPVANPLPVGFFSPGLITNKAFTFGSVTAVAGTNAVLPLIIGFEWNNPWIHSDASQGGVAFGWASGLDVVRFDPPIRVYRNTTLAVQQLDAIGPGELVQFQVTFLYRERPRTTP